MIGKVRVLDRRPYVVIEPMHGAPRLRGKYDLFVIPLAAVGSVIEDYLEKAWDDEEGVVGPIPLTFTIHEWTEREHEAYCQDNDIEEG